MAAPWLAPNTASAASFTTTRFDDPAPNGCLPADCSLREAVRAANATSGATITLRAGTYTLTIRGNDTPSPNVKVGDLDLMKPMTINGAGSGSTVIRAGTAKGAGIHRIFDNFAAAPGVKISNMSIRYGSDVEARTGGCIKNTGTLTLSHVIVALCTSPVGGGGVSSYGNLTVDYSTISNNSVASASRQVNGGGLSSGPQSSGAPGTVTVTHSSISNNSARSTRPYIGYGGGFVNTATMTIQDSVITNNVADSSAGGLSDPHFSSPAGSLTIQRTTFAGNKATRDAGGMTNDGVATISATTFSANQGGYQCSGTDCDQGYVGGLLSTKTATTRVFNSTFSGNWCRIGGGGLAQSAGGFLYVRSSTIVNNTCATRAGGISSNANGTVYLMNTIVANNTAPIGPDCMQLFTSQGYNLVETPGPYCKFTGNTSTNILGRDPILGPLMSNGGPTQTHALLAGSPALNTADPSGCKDTAGTLLATDQRGSPRTAGGRCDIGAYELQ
jgi:hypothetical protein